MALREFEYLTRRWRAWDVYPTRGDFVERRRLIATVAVERRRRELGRRLPDGWLAFECPETGERRCVTPIPRYWERMPDHELRELCAGATPRPPGRA